MTRILLGCLAFLAPVVLAQDSVIRTSHDVHLAFGVVRVTGAAVHVGKARVAATGDLRTKLERLNGLYVEVEVNGGPSLWEASRLRDPRPSTLWAWVPREADAPVVATSRPSDGKLEPTAPLSRLLERQRARAVEVRAYSYRNSRSPVPVGLRARTAAGRAWVVGWDEARDTVTLRPEGPGPEFTLPSRQVEIGEARTSAARLQGRVQHVESYDSFLLATADGSSVALEAGSYEALPLLWELDAGRRLEVEGVWLDLTASAPRLLVTKLLNGRRRTELTGWFSSDGDELTTGERTYTTHTLIEPAPPLDPALAKRWSSVLQVLRRTKPTGRVTVGGWEFLEPSSSSRQLVVTELRASGGGGDDKSGLWTRYLLTGDDGREMAHGHRYPGEYWVTDSVPAGLLRVGGSPFADSSPLPSRPAGAQRRGMADALPR